MHHVANEGSRLERVITASISLTPLPHDHCSIASFDYRMRALYGMPCKDSKNYIWSMIELQWFINDDDSSNIQRNQGSNVFMAFCVLGKLIVIAFHGINKKNHLNR